MKPAMIFVLFIALAGIALAGKIAENDETPDSKLLVSLGSKQYYFSEFTANWFEASNFCHYIAMELVKIEDVVKSNLITEQMGVKGIQNIFTSGFKMGSSWLWGDGTSLNYTNWSENQPENNNEYCLVVNLPTNEDDPEWHNDSCRDQNNFVCEDIVA